MRGRIIVVAVAITAAVVFGASVANAQISIGAGGGLTRIGLGGDAPSGSSWAAQFGFLASLHAEVFCTDDVSITFQPDLHTRSTAQQFSIAIDTNALFAGDTTVDSAFINTTYVSVPFGVRVYTDALTWFFTTGVAAHFLSSIEIDTLTGSYEPENALRTIDASVFLGVGYRIPISDEFYSSIELRYQQGFLDLIGDDQPTNFRNATLVRMSGLQARVSFEWRIFE